MPRAPGAHETTLFRLTTECITRDGYRNLSYHVYHDKRHPNMKRRRRWQRLCLYLFNHFELI